MPGGIMRARTVGRDTDLRMPSLGGWRVTLGFTDPTAGDSSNRCAVMGGTLRPARTGGLRYPCVRENYVLAGVQSPRRHRVFAFFFLVPTARFALGSRRHA